MAEILRHPDQDTLAAALARDVTALLRQRQATGATPCIALTGGSLARLLHRRLSEAVGVDWSRVELWWGDERYVAPDDPERNDGQATEDLLGHVALNPALVHRMPAADGSHPDVEAAAAAYAQALETRLDRLPADEPCFDLVLLGIGPDGHCASLFPGHPGVHAEGTTVAVRDSPKPPPQRISLTMTTLGNTRRVWFLAAGQEKAGAVAASVRGVDVDTAPSAGPRGRDDTRWYVDQAAAQHL